MAQPHPSILVVPGAWHQPAAYEKLVTSLRNSGYSTTVTNLPSCNAPDPQNATCSADAEAVRQEILLSIDADGKYLVVVCHSYGGIPGGGAAYGLSKTARATDGKEGGVLGLIYVSGFVVAEKSSLLETLGGQHAPYVDPHQPSPNQSTIKGPRDVLFNDLNFSEATYLTNLLRPTSMRAFDSPAPAMAWADLEFRGKIAYVRCLKDQALPPFLQDMFMEKSGVGWKVEDIEASHSAYASRPDELANVLGELARQFAE